MNIKDYRAHVNKVLEDLEKEYGPDIEVVSWSESLGRYTEDSAANLFYVDVVQASSLLPQPKDVKPFHLLVKRVFAGS